MGLSSHAWGTFSAGQHALKSCTNITTCAITITSGTAGRLGVVYIQGNNANNLTLNSVSGNINSTTGWTLCASCHFRDGTNWVEMAYTLSTQSGDTTITITMSGAVGTNVTAGYVDFGFTSGPVSLDTQGVGDESGVACTSCAGITLTLTGTNDVIIQQAVAANNITAVSAGWTIVDGCNFANSGGCVADSLNTNSGTGPTWTQQASGIVDVGAIAFKETAAAGKPSGQFPRVY